MNKQDLIGHVATTVDLSKAASAMVVDAVFAGIIKSLGSDNKARFIGFGSFTVTKTKARKGRNPKTGEEIKIPARKRVRFVPGAPLRQAINT